MSFRQFIIFLLLSMPLTSSAQKVTLSGYVTDAGSGERMISAAVYEKASFAGTTTNNYGFFSLPLQKGKNEIVVSFLGYKPVSLLLNLTGDTIIQFNLELSARQLEEVTITATRQSKVESSQMSMIDIPVTKFVKLPVLLGEADVLKVIQLLPGVQSGTEGTTGIYVRGGGPDQNLFLLDGVPVYNASHLFGFLSVFNPDAVKSVQLYTGGFPARYGERLSSVVDIRMKEGNEKEVKGHFSIGLISSKLSVEGPIVKDKTSFIISLRRTYADLLAIPIMARINMQNGDGYRTTGGYNFYDLNFKVNHKLSDRSRIYLSSYMGRDRAFFREKGTYSYSSPGYSESFENTDKFSLGWGNVINALRWNYLFSNRLFGNATVTYSRYRFDITSESERKDLVRNTSSGDYFRYFSGIDDLSGRIDFDYFPSSSHSVKFGAAYTYHNFKPGITRFKYDFDNYSNGIDTIFGDEKIYANEFIAYAEDNFAITSRLKVNAGMRLSLFNVQDTSYLSLQPRISVRFLISDNLSLKASYSKMNQFVHLLTTSALSLPTDLWLPVTRRFEPPVAHQVAVGSGFRLPWRLEMTVEAFYKSMDNLIEYKEGAFFASTGSGWESKVEKGRGWAYGAELMVEKTWGNTTGWIGYTIARTERQFENLNYGRVFPAKYDRRHDISLALTHKFGDRFDMGLVWVFGTGNAATLGVIKYPPMEMSVTRQGPYHYYDDITHYPSRNNYRTPSYHRLDLGVNFHKEKKNGVRTWNISVYNAYNRLNPFFIFWDSVYHYGPDPNNPGQYIGYYEPVLRKISLFPIIPSFSYSFKF